MTESQRKHAVFLDTLSIPSPGEVFSALDTIFHPNWVTLENSAAVPITMERTQLALVAGVLTANGYIAVQAHDGSQVKDIGRKIMSVAKVLGVSTHLMGRGNSLMGFAENSEWDSLADELEATENEIKRTMADQKDANLVTLISIAAWLRGFEVALGIVLAEPDLKNASVIRQPELVRHLASQLNGLPEKMRKTPLISSLSQTLDESASLLSAPGMGSEESRSKLKHLHDEVSARVREILTSPPTTHPAP